MPNDIQTNMQNHDSSNIFTILFGAFLAICNHVFGWMNAILDIHVAGFLVTTLQAMVTGSLGAFSAYYTNKFLKRRDKKKQDKI